MEGPEGGPEIVGDLWSELRPGDDFLGHDYGTWRAFGEGRVEVNEAGQLRKVTVEEVVEGRYT
jgi:hypothetical protein